MLMPKLSLALMIFCIAIPSVQAQETVRRLTQEEAVKAAVSKPQPDYPPVAKQLRIQGRIEVEISIDPSGSVDSVKVLTGNSALTGTALRTLKRWRFEPFQSGGKPVRAVAALTFSFKL